MSIDDHSKQAQKSIDLPELDDDTVRNTTQNSNEMATANTDKEHLDHKKRSEKTDDRIEGSRLGFVLAGLLLAVFCLGLDQSILATAIPKITTHFNSLDDVAWYGSSYLLTTCCFQLLFGKLYAEFDLKWIFLATLAIFELGSVLCATAVSSLMLILGRSVAGIGCAGILSGTMMLIVQTLPLKKRPIITGAVGGVSAISKVIAPALGGVFTDKATWRLCFWINLPLGAITAMVVFFLVSVPVKQDDGKKRGFRSFVSKVDIWGNIFFMPYVICLLLALQWGGVKYPWSNWRIILCLSLFGVFFLIWVFIQFKQGDKATLPLRVARQRSVASGTFYVIGMGGAMFVLTYYVPIWFQAVKDDSADKSGTNFLAASGSLGLASILSGIMTSKTGHYVPQMLCGSVVTSVAAGLIFRYSLDTSTAYWAGTLVMFGFGTGFGLQLPITAVQTILKGPDISLGTSVIILAQVLSGVIFLSVGQNLFQQTLIKELAIKAPKVDAQVVISNGVSGIQDLIAGMYGQTFARQVLEAYNAALKKCFLVCVILSALTILAGMTMEWKSVKAKKPEKTAA